MNVTITGATGLIGKGIVKALRERGDEVTVLSRDPSGATAKLGVTKAAAAGEETLVARPGVNIKVSRAGERSSASLEHDQVVRQPRIAAMRRDAAVGQC